MTRLLLLLAPLQPLLPLLLVVLPSFSTATITIAGTGARFASHPDRRVGTRWMEGYEYMARLQLLDYDLDLCSMDDNNNTVVPVPTDGLPVVLVTRGDDCSDMQKVETALARIQPRGIVQYLIIYNDAVHPPVGRRQLTDDQPEQQHETHYDEHMYDHHGVQWPHRHHSNDYEHRMGVLHVSYKTGNALVNIIRDQSPQDEAYGGPRVLLDGSASSEGTFVRNLLFWFGITVMMAGCLCSFCLSVRLTTEDHTAGGPGAAATRPARRRLTREQVEEWFPDYLSDYENEDEQHPQNDDDNCHFECSICLDDMKSGCYLRKLPCAHEFHSHCIGKWLCERHATCPLCKLDLLPEEEEDEEEALSMVVDATTADDDDAHSTTQEEERANRFSILQFLIGSLQRSNDNTTAAVGGTPEVAVVTSDNDNDDDAVDQTPLLEDQDNV
mmetsp:Transcript_28569/g.47278  ORF Transcript_28569/g.47278 Transcript_28569/m.47278 type:complete len:441 (+) Transcript_28569:257-1579(+)